MHDLDLIAWPLGHPRQAAPSTTTTAAGSRDAAAARIGNDVFPWSDREWLKLANHHPQWQSCGWLGRWKTSLHVGESRRSCPGSANRERRPNGT